MHQHIWKQGLAAALVLLLALPASAHTDMADHWARETAVRWTENGVLEAVDGQFLPEREMTRAELASALARLLQLETAAPNVYPDLPDSAPDAAGMLRCAAAGILQGNSGRMEPQRLVTREEAAVMLARALGIAPLQRVRADFDDASEISDWAAGYVAALAQDGILSGVGGNRFAPKAGITRASFATILDKAINSYIHTPGSRVAVGGDGLSIVSAPGVTVAGQSETLLALPGREGILRLEQAEIGTLRVASDGCGILVDEDASVQRLLVEADGVLVEVAAGGSVQTVELLGDGAMVFGEGDVRTVAACGADGQILTGGTTVRAAPESTGTVAGDFLLLAGAQIRTDPLEPDPAPEAPQQPIIVPVQPPMYIEVPVPQEPEEPEPEPEPDPEPEPLYTVTSTAAEGGTVAVDGGGTFTEWPRQITAVFVPDTGYVLQSAALSRPDLGTVDITDAVLQSTAGKPSGQYRFPILDEPAAGDYVFSATFVRGVRVDTMAELADALNHVTTEPGDTVLLGADIQLDEAIAADWGAVAEQFTGTLDGCGHTLYANGAHCGYLIRQTVEDVTIRRLNLVQGGAFVGLIGYANQLAPADGTADVLLEDIAVQSAGGRTVELLEGDSSFVSYVGGLPGTSVTFRRCVNGADLHIGGLGHGGIFIGGYVGGRRDNLGGQLHFADCVNRGTVTGTHLGFFTGDECDVIDTRWVTVSGCVNEGVLRATASCHWFAANEAGAGGALSASDQAVLSGGAANAGVMEVVPEPAPPAGEIVSET